jgi:hypothetical protein
MERGSLAAGGAELLAASEIASFVWLSGWLACEMRTDAGKNRETHSKSPAVLHELVCEGQGDCCRIMEDSFMSSRSIRALVDRVRRNDHKRLRSASGTVQAGSEQTSPR